MDEWPEEVGVGWKADIAERLYLCRDGTLCVAARYTQDGAPEPVLTELPPRDVIERYDLGEIITALHRAIVQQAGRRYESTLEATVGARKIGALSTLLD